MFEEIEKEAGKQIEALVACFMRTPMTEDEYNTILDRINECTREQYLKAAMWQHKRLS